MRCLKSRLAHVHPSRRHCLGVWERRHSIAAVALKAGIRYACSADTCDGRLSTGAASALAGGTPTSTHTRDAAEAGVVVIVKEAVVPVLVGLGDVLCPADQRWTRMASSRGSIFGRPIFFHYGSSD